MTHLQFVAAWIDCRTGGAKAVAERLGRDSHWVNCIAASLRRRGVLLPPMPRYVGGQRPSSFSDPLDVDALNKFITKR